MDRAEEAMSLARAYMEMATENYLADGYLTPTLILLDEDHEGMIFVPGPLLPEHPGDAMAALLLVTAKAMPLDRFVTIVETWVKAYDKDDAPNLQRGDLARLSESDPGVETALMVAVWDPHNWDDSASITSRFGTVVDIRGDDLTYGLGLEPTERKGAMEGGMLTTFKRAYDAAPPQPYQDKEMMCEVLVRNRVASVAQVLISDE